MALPFIKEAQALLAHEVARVKDFVVVTNPLEGQLLSQQELVDSLRIDLEQADTRYESLKRELEDVRAKAEKDFDALVRENNSLRNRLLTAKKERDANRYEADSYAEQVRQALVTRDEEVSKLTHQEEVLRSMLGKGARLIALAGQVIYSQDIELAMLRLKYEALYDEVSTTIPRFVLRFFNRDMADIFDMFPSAQEEADFEDEQEIFFDDLKNTPSDIEN